MSAVFIVFEMSDSLKDFRGVRRAISKIILNMLLLKSFPIRRPLEKMRMSNNSSKSSVHMIFSVQSNACVSFGR